MIGAAMGLAKMGSLVLNGLGLGKVLDVFDSDDEKKEQANFFSVGVMMVLMAVAAVGAYILARKK